MGRKSSMTRLPPAIRAEVDKLLSDPATTIDDIVATLQELGHARSRSAVGRFKQNHDEIMAQHRESVELGSMLAARAKTGDHDAEQIVQALASNVAFQRLRELASDPAQATTIGAQDMYFFANAAKSLAGARALDTSRIMKIRDQAAKETAAKAGAAVEKLGKSQGLTKDVVAQLRAAVIGVA